MKYITLFFLALAMTATSALADDVAGPTHPGIGHANIRGLMLGQTPPSALAALAKIHARIQYAPHTNCERARLDNLRAGRDADLNGIHGACIAEIDAQDGFAHVSIAFAEDPMTHAEFAYEITYRYKQVTDGDAMAALAAATDKYGTPTFESSASPSDTVARWLPIACGSQTWPDGSITDPCAGASDETPYLLMDTSGHTLILRDGPRYQRALKTRTALEQRLHTAHTTF